MTDVVEVIDQAAALSTLEVAGTVIEVSGGATTVQVTEGLVQTVEITQPATVEADGPAEIALVDTVIEIVEPAVEVIEVYGTVANGPPGPQGLQGPPGPQGLPGEPGTGSGLPEIGGYPISIVNPGNGDVLSFQGYTWVNQTKATITDGGNF